MHGLANMTWPSNDQGFLDLLSGTGAYEPWLGSTVPGDSTTCP